MDINHIFGPEGYDVVVGRSMLPSLESDGVNGVKKFLSNIQSELRFIMSCTGFEHVEDIDASTLYEL